MKRGFVLLLVFTLLISFSSAYEIYYYHSDNLGSPVAITDENASVVWSVDYKPFGESFNEIGDNSYQYNSKELDDSGLYYYNARYYDAEIGRFMTADSVKGNIASPQSLNRYVYTLNNPLKFVDPNGNEPVVAVYFGNRQQQDIFLNQFENYKKYSSSWREYKIPENNVKEGALENTQKLQSHISDAKYILLGGHHYSNTNVIFHGEHSETPNYGDYNVDAAVSLNFENKIYESAKAVFLVSCNTLYSKSPMFDEATNTFPNAALLGYASTSAANINADIMQRFFNYANEFGGIDKLNSNNIAMLWTYSGYEIYNEKFGEDTNRNVVGMYKEEGKWLEYSSANKEQMQKVKDHLTSARQSK